MTSCPFCVAAQIPPITTPIIVPAIAPVPIFPFEIAAIPAPLAAPTPEPKATFPAALINLLPHPIVLTLSPSPN